MTVNRYLNEGSEHDLAGPMLLLALDISRTGTFALGTRTASGQSTASLSITASRKVQLHSIGCLRSWRV